ncbi:uncharacterized protein LOC108676620 [Hyalella azteca]|uniref:Uncharacterized protein LOC108676620 n=1 Tax=Hyalella azteca TaxID=294128 RepID=A0A8B7P2H0_HYAAZ|nr:uncharacterized protein LOC108676620 [Hyalella azteca]
MVEVVDTVEVVVALVVEDLEAREVLVEVASAMAAVASAMEEVDSAREEEASVEDAVVVDTEATVALLDSHQEEVARAAVSAGATELRSPRQSFNSKATGLATTSNVLISQFCMLQRSER